MVGLFLAALTLGLLIFAAQLLRGAVQSRMADEGFSPPARERVFTVNVVRAESDTVVPVLETFGEIQSRRMLELRAPVGGRVVDLAPGFEDGGTVREGEVLVRIDPVEAQSAVDSAEADLADARAEERDAARNLALARDELAAAEEQAVLRTRAYERQRDLAERGVGTATATETAELAASSARGAVLSRRQAAAQGEARVDQAATRILRAELALAEAQRRLAETAVIAPFDGTLSETNVVAGRLVAANERLAELIDPDDLEVSFRVSTAQYSRLLDASGDLVNADVAVELDAAGVDLIAQGRISRASVTAGEGATGRLIFAALEQPVGFKPGDFVTVRVREPALADVIRLPAAAMDATGEVLVLTEEDRLEGIAVELVRRQGDDILVRGPVIGRDVVEARSPLLGAGIGVRPLRRPAPEDDATADAEGTDAEGQQPGADAMLALSDERRARLVAFVEGNTRMPEDAKARVLARLAEPLVPARMVARIEDRMGG